MTDLIIGGLVVSAFSLISDLFKPKIFAGPFGAAHSVALASGSLSTIMVSISTSGLKLAKWYDYFSRFALGGLVTAVAGLLSKKIRTSFG
jgi:hypothetical protein